MVRVRGDPHAMTLRCRRSGVFQSGAKVLDSRAGNPCIQPAATVQKRRGHQTRKHPVADVLIGAFATRFEGLLTRNAGDFQKLFPSLGLLEP